jgi:oligopeptide/dipeptide ABC transporter ATP-binding protein
MSTGPSVAQPASPRGLLARLNRPALHAFLRAPSALVGLVIVSIVLLDILLAPWLFGHGAETQDVEHTLQQPSFAHPLGTNELGQDILDRTLVAARLTVGIALGAASISVFMGALLGAGAAVAPPWLRTGIRRMIDTMVAFPALILVIFISIISGRGALGAMLGVGIAGSFGFARLTSTLALSVAGRDFVSAARTVGVGRVRLMTTHVLPNLAEPLLISASFLITYAMLAIAGLSFLGLGVQSPDYDWGTMLTLGVKSIYITPAAALGPAVALAITALSFGFLGESLARASNPMLWTRASTRPRPADGAAGAAPGLELAPGGVGANGSAPDARAAQWRSPRRTPRADDEPNALEVRDLVVSVDDGPELVRSISFSVPVGGVLGIVGESGSGKTMTALAVSDLLPDGVSRRGEVLVHGSSLDRTTRFERRRLLGTEVAMVFQDPLSSLNPALTVGRQLGESLEVHAGVRRRAAHARAVASLREVHIPAPEAQVKRYPHEFSGGMRQRVMIAMGLIHEPSVLICDEPTTALDVTIQAQVMSLLREVNRAHGTAIVLISHNLALIAQTCDRILVMYAGRVVEDLTREELLTNPRHPYTRALVGAVPTVGPAPGEPLTAIAGDVPDPAHLPEGCAFHPRCPLASRGIRERPPLVRHGESRVACWAVEEGVA